MDDLQKFSIYHFDQAQPSHPAGENPLGFLIGDPEHGWQVARSLRKPLNHLDFLRRKEAIAQRLNLHNTLTPPEIFAANYRLLEQHQAGELTTAAVIDHLAGQLNGAIPPAEIPALLREYATVRHMEFHPTDRCNLFCKECSYGQDDLQTRPAPVHYPFDGLRKIMQLQPASMVIIGGGEPTLYREHPYRFQELVEELLAHRPSLRLALVSNGTHLPPGPWPAAFSWIRLSLDAATPQTYQAFRGRPFFERVLHNFLRYLDTPAPYVGVSFLFARSNIHEYARVAELIYHLVRREKPHCLPKVNIQYRPLRRDPWNDSAPFTEAITPDQIEAAVREVIALARSSPEMEAFLRDQTNITAVLGGNTHPAYEFSRCFYSQTFKIVRANGDVRPCFVRVMEPDFLLGNILHQPLETLALNTLLVGAKRKTGCTPQGCRQCHVNAIFENGLCGAMLPSRSAEVLADPMY